MEDHNLSIPTVPQWIGMPLFLFVKLSWKYVISKVYIEAKLIFYGTWFMFPTYRHFFLQFLLFTSNVIKQYSQAH